VNVNSLYADLENDLAFVETQLHNQLRSIEPVLEEMSLHLLQAGGKRLRPVFVLLSGAFGTYDKDQLARAAVALELIHMASLVHDDVVDKSPLRRGRPTANHVWDNSTAVLVGDFLYSRSFQMMISLNNMECMRILAEATNMIAEGEVLQLTHQHQPDVNEASYLKVIQLKTAKLFEAAAQLGAVMAEEPSHIQQALARYGMHIGIAFQLVDDVLDYRGSNEHWGKNIGNDLSEGKATLPLIYAMKQGTASQSQQIQQAIKDGNVKDLAMIQEAIVSTGAIDYTMAVAKKEIQQAKATLKHLPPSPYRDALRDLTTFAISRGN